ncbi:MAG: SAM-dependent methyltransferase [Bacteroidales bacterium]|nr:SAM-dependent methyltransferase [Bacteroidales bacterium]
MGVLYLIPTPLCEEASSRDILPEQAAAIIPTLKLFVVENVRTARRFLSKAGLKGQIDSLQFFVLDEHSTDRDVEALMNLFESGENVGLMSEAGLPAVADPGARLVALCHKKGIKVVPLIGPSSLMMTLMASGLNGQQFTFNGYLPAKPAERRAALKDLEKKRGCSQILIETPYRNDALMADALAVLSPETLLTLGINITAPDETIVTKTIAAWRKNVPEIGKRPCVFIILG